MSERLVNALTETIHEAEQMRVAAASEGYSDKRYIDALGLVKSAIDAFEVGSDVPLFLYEEDDPRILAGICHLYIMAATVQQSRAKHTLESDPDKIAALKDASQQLEKAMPIGQGLSDQGYM